MTFLHLSLLAGGLLAAIPILLHLWSQRPPKPLVFPALRFVKLTIQSHKRSWQVRQWLLLALRALVLLLMAYALARPSVHSDMLATWLSIGGVALLAALATVVAFVALASKKQLSIIAVSGITAGFLWLCAAVWGISALARGSAPPALQQNTPVAAVIVIDTSPVMDYRFSNQSRLEVAKERATELIQRLPSESKIAIITQPNGQFALDRMTALRQLERVELQYQSSNLPRMIQWANQLVRNEKLDRREIYVITDLSLSAWGENQEDDLKEALSKEPMVLLQIIDVGIKSPQNWRLGDLQLSQSELAPGGSVAAKTTVTRTADTAGDRITVELLAEKNDPELPVIRDGKMVVPEAAVIQRQFVDLTVAETADVEFEIRDLLSGTYQYRFRVDRGDPLGSDDQRFLTLSVGDVGKILLAGSPGDMRNQLALILGAGGGEAIEEIDLTKLREVKLDQFEVVVLQDPVGVTEADLVSIERFISDGGGVLLILGPSVGTPEAVSQSPLAKLLPGKPARISRRALDDRSVYLVPDRPAHPLFQYFGGRVTEAPFSSLPVFRHWDIEPVGEGINYEILVRYSLSGMPAIISQNRGKGRVLTWTTMVPEASYQKDRSPWNELTSAADWWPTFGLLLGSIRYLGSDYEDRVNYALGQSAVLTNPPEKYPDQYRIFNPKGDSTKLEARGGSIVVPSLQFPGVYRLKGNLNGPVARGFSVNSSGDATSLRRITQEQLHEILGEENCRIAVDMKEVQQSVGAARYGRELFPFAILLICGMLLGEQWMANRFYQLNFGSKTAQVVRGTTK